VKTLLVTGYRAHELNIFDQKHKGIPYIRKAIAERIAPLAEDGLEWVITPGQYGFDLWACESVIALKKQYPQLKLSIVTAFQNPEEKWKEEKQTYYRRILQDVDYYGTVSKQPYAGPWQFQARDELLLKKSDGILMFYDEEALEGSPKYMNEKALKKHREEGYEYWAIRPEDVERIAEEERMDAYE